MLGAARPPLLLPKRRANPLTRRGSSRPNTSLVQIVIDPLAKWKTSLETFRKARSLGMEVVVALDSRSSPGSYKAVKEVADVVLEFENKTVWPEVILNDILQEAHRDWVARIEDDEEPSQQLWDFLAKPPPIDDGGQPFLWRFRMVAPLPDWSAAYTPLTTLQPRYYPRLGLRHPGGFDQLPQSPYREIDCEIVLWHYVLWAPRAHRERKVKDHEAAWMQYWKSHPWPPSSNKAYLWEDYPSDRTPLDQWSVYLPAVRTPHEMQIGCSCALCTA